MDYKVIGSMRLVNSVSAACPEFGLGDIEAVLSGRRFNRWYHKHRRLVNSLALAAPVVAMKLFHVSPYFLTGILLPHVAIPVVAGGASFISGHGVIMLHMLIVGFLTLVVSTFLRFTGRGDLIPLIVFVGGGIILYEVLGLFKDIYVAVESFLNM